MPTDITRILHVEDNRGDAMLLKEALRYAGKGRFEVCWCERLQLALDALQRQAFDAVLLDLNLPDSKGLPTLAQVRAAAPAAPILIVTGMEDEEAAIQAIRQGAQDYLVKGALDARNVTRAILYAVDRKRAEEALRQMEQREREAAIRLAWGQSAIDTINAMREGVVLLELDGTITSINPAGERMTGLAGARPTCRAPPSPSTPAASFGSFGRVG